MNKILMMVLSAGFVVSVSSANETVGEKVSDAAKDADRAVKKGGHRVQEAFCAEGDLKCAAKKGKNRVNEGGAAVKDGAKELKDKVD